MTGKPPNQSLQKKTAARMAAAQCLYRLAINHEALDPIRQVETLKAQLHNNRNEQKLQVGVPLEPNYTLLTTLLTGVEQWRADIDERLNGCLDKDWKRERMSPLLIGILQCGIFELFFHKDTNAKIVIDEYTRLARSFFTDNEINFVHGALSALVQRYHG